MCSQAALRRRHVDLTCEVERLDRLAFSGELTEDDAKARTLAYEQLDAVLAALS